MYLAARVAFGIGRLTPPCRPRSQARVKNASRTSTSQNSHWSLIAFGASRPDGKVNPRTLFPGMQANTRSVGLAERGSLSP